MSPETQFKYDLADELMTSAVNNIEAAFPDARFDVLRISTLHTQIKVWEDKDNKSAAPRYFSLVLRESM